MRLPSRLHKHCDSAAGPYCGAALDAMLGRCLIVAVLLTAASLAAADPDSSQSLRAAYAGLQEQLHKNPFDRPIHVESLESSDSLAGDVYALIDHPFDVVAPALSHPAAWCDILILHLNVKYCRPTKAGDSDGLVLYLGRKHEQPLDEDNRLVFDHRVMDSESDYFSVQMEAEDGPLSTGDYRIALETVSIDRGQTFLHLTYSYTYGLPGRTAMRLYLATFGSGKVGFSRVDRGTERSADYVGGVRGVIERNTMRYFLAIDAYLDALTVPPAERLETRLQSWFTATEQYPRQLREIDRDAYLDMKRNEYLRMQAAYADH